MYYAIYKNIRNSTWQCLLDFQINSLPVDVLKIATMAGVHVIKNSLIRDLRPGEYGKAYFNGQKWIVIYDDTKPTVVSRFTLAHELGHIFLGHHLAYIKYAEIRQFHKIPKSEQQADTFAQRLLCPACILWGLNLHTPTEISQYCRVSTDVANIRAKRMESLYQKNKFLTNKLEQELYQNFLPYLKNQKGESHENSRSIYPCI